jgi:hypothetical protein
MDENAAVILHQPTVFLAAVGRTVMFLKHEYLEEFVGKLGALEIQLPTWIPWVYLALLFSASAMGSAGNLARWQRIVLAGMFLANVGAMYAVVWTIETTHQALTTDMVTGTGWISGVQGRYVIPFSLLPLIAASGLVMRLSRRWIIVLALAFVGVVNGVALDLVWDRFQAHSSTIPNRIRMAFGAPSSLYEQRFVSSRNSEAMPFLVTGGVRRLAPNQLSITSRGYRLPNDILLLSDQELAAIPLGAPLEAPNDYEGQLVRRPGSSPEDGKVYYVHNGEKRWILNGQWIASHGYKWPDDVHTIPAADLARFPEAAPIQ